MVGGILQVEGCFVVIVFVLRTLCVLLESRVRSSVPSVGLVLGCTAVPTLTVCPLPFTDTNYGLSKITLSKLYAIVYPLKTSLRL